MRKLLASLAAALALTALAPAQDSAPGVITLKNGDRISGTITSITADEVQIQTAATGADAIKVAMSEVADITTSGPLNLELDDGERIAAPVQGYADGQLRVGDGAVARDLPIGRMVTYTPPVVWSGSINLGGLLATGNTERRAANAQAQLMRRDDDTRLTLRASWDYGEQKTRGDFDGDPNTPDTLGDWELAQRRSFGSGKFDYFVTDDLYAYAQATAENDRLADLRLRFTGGAGLGYLIVDEDDLMLQGEVGLTYIDEDRYTAGADNSFTAARLAYGLRWDITGDTQFLQDAEFYPSIEDAEDFYCRVDSRLRTTVLADMFAQFQHILDYDSTPSPGFERADNRFIVSLGWSF